MDNEFFEKASKMLNKFYMGEFIPHHEEMSKHYGESMFGTRFQKPELFFRRTHACTDCVIMPSFENDESARVELMLYSPETHKFKTAIDNWSKEELEYFSDFADCF